MADVIVGIVVAIILAFMFSDDLVKILSARKNVQLKIERERTEQKRLDLEIAKVNAGLVSSSEG